MQRCVEILYGLNVSIWIFPLLLQQIQVMEELIHVYLYLYIYIYVHFFLSIYVLLL